LPPEEALYNRPVWSTVPVGDALSAMTMNPR
jgi:hypothetical protein